MADTSAIKKDTFLRFKDGIFVITEFQHVNPGKGSAFVRTRMRNVTTGKVIENTFKVGEDVDVIELSRSNMQFLYRDDNSFNFMDQSYEQHAIPAELLGEKGQYLKEGTDVVVLLDDETPLSVDIPKKMKFKVVESSAAVRGDTATGGRMLKEVTLDNGMKCQVPLFIDQGEEIVVNTDSGEYVERAR